jgi:hypothetical protein
MIQNKNFLSVGDLIDLYFKVSQNGYNELLSKFHISEDARTISKWKSATSLADFRNIPEIRTR